MGNCTGRHRSKEQLTMEDREHHHPKVKTASLRKCHSDYPINTSITSPVSDNSESTVKLNRNNGATPCRIPVLRDVLTSSTQSCHLKGGYKSVLCDRPTSSRIPVTSTTVECRKSIPRSVQDGDLDNSQFNESGFVSDLSVTASTYSQVCTESKSTDTVDHRNTRTDEVTITANRLPPNKPTHLSIRDRMAGNPTNIVNARASTVGPFTPMTTPLRPSVSSTKSISTYNIDNTLRRPQSISTETEVLMHKSMIKRCSEGSEVMSPSAIMHEHSAVMQDVSSLKLMLHKLKRYLTQDNDDRVSDVPNDCVFRLCSPSTANIKSLTREELEQKYEALLEHNISLERLLQSREKVIAQLQAEKLRGADGGLESGLGDHVDHRGTGDYHWPHIKMPAEHI